MKQRPLLIAANWKMNPPPEAAFEAGSPYRAVAGVDVIVFPTFVDLRECIAAGIVTGAQYGHPDATGAYTGDISMSMLKALGCSHVLCGHSERRQHHGESDEDVARQTKSALALGMHPIVCIGETAKERDAGAAEKIVGRQLSALPLDAKITLAYEPVWAIGTGNTATPALAQEMHAFLRSLLPSKCRETMRILYGGSMKPENAEELLGQPDIDGGLIGGASLNPKGFGAIIQTAASL